MNRHIFLQYEQPEASPGLLFFIGVLLVLSALSCGVVVGFEWRDMLQRQADEAAKLKPRPVATKPVFLIGCDRPAVEEVARTCRARFKSAQIGGRK